MSRICGQCGTPVERHPRDKVGRSCPIRPLNKRERKARGLPATAQPDEVPQNVVDWSMLEPV